MAHKPTIDFDLDGPFAAVQTMALMCRLGARARSALVAKLGLGISEIGRKEYAQFLREVGDTVLMWKTLKTNEPGAMYGSIEMVARDEGHRASLLEFATHFAAPARGTLANFSLEPRFWIAAFRAHQDGVFEHTPMEFIRDNLIEPAGGDSALIEGPSKEAWLQEVSGCVTGKPMLAGLSLYLAAVLNRIHTDLSDSFDNTYRIIAACRDTFRISWSHAKKELPPWRPVAPLWAGLLIEADCWTEDTLLDLNRLHVAFYDIVFSGARRARLYSYAKWFTKEFLPTYGHDQASNKEAIRETLALPDSIKADMRELRPLPIKAIGHAKRVNKSNGKRRAGRKQG